MIGSQLHFSDLLKFNKTLLIISIPQSADYQITRAETITVALPSSALASRTALVATPAAAPIAALADLLADRRADRRVNRHAPTPE